MNMSDFSPHKCTYVHTCMHIYTLTLACMHVWLCIRCRLGQCGLCEVPQTLNVQRDVCALQSSLAAPKMQHVALFWLTACWFFRSKVKLVNAMCYYYFYNFFFFIVWATYDSVAFESKMILFLSLTLDHCQWQCLHVCMHACVYACMHVCTDCCCHSLIRLTVLLHCNYCLFCLLTFRSFASRFRSRRVRLPLRLRLRLLRRLCLPLALRVSFCQLPANTVAFNLTEIGSLYCT